MARALTYVFVYLSGRPVPAGRLDMTEESRAQFATFAYGRRYLERTDRIPVGPFSLPLHDPGIELTYRTEGRISRLQWHPRRRAGRLGSIPDG